MGDFVTFLLRASIIISFFLAFLAGFILFFNLLISLFNVTLNHSVISDIGALINIWLPFNLSGIYIWLMLAANAFLFYRMGMVVFTWLNRLFGGNNG